MCPTAAAFRGRTPCTAAVVAESRRCDCRLPPAVVGPVSYPALRTVAHRAGCRSRPSYEAGSRRTLDRVAEKVPKRKAKARPGTPGVLGTLPASRPERLGAPRGKAPAKKAPAHGPRAVSPGASALRPHR